MQHLFKFWESFSADVRAASRILLLSDYDGTLVTIVSRPELAILLSEVRDKLSALVKKPPFFIGVISGRSLSSVKKMVGIEGIYYAGNHGLEMEGPGFSFTSPAAQEARPDIEQLVSRLRGALGGVRGIIIEDKGLSLSVHYRLVDEKKLGQVCETFSKITAPVLQKGKVKICAGKKVWDVVPSVDWDKGKAVQALREKIEKLYQPARLLTVYLGDDTTDEDAFKIVRQPGGWSIFVGETNSSVADYYLSSTEEVSTFLSRLAGLR